MKIAISAYADDAYEASCIIEALKKVTEIRIDSYSGREKLSERLDKPPVKPAPEAVVEETPAERPNVSPGKPLISKIGTATTAEITKILNIGQQPPAKFKEHLKLLWSRGEVCFDGSEYYLSE